MNYDEFNYERDRQIDPTALDVEWLDQANRFGRYAEAAAYAEQKLDKAKETLEVIKAQLDSRIRQDPDKYLGKDVKITNPAVDAVILQHKDYTEANETYLKAKLNFGLLTAAVKTMAQRKDALENLVRLQGQNYFASPREPRDLGQEWNKRAQQSGQQQAQTAIRTSMTKTRTKP